MTQRNSAQITGVSLLLMTVIAGYAMGYAYPLFYDPTQIDATKKALLQYAELYQNMLYSISGILVLDVVVSYTLYRFFETVDPKLSRVAAILRMVYTVIFGIGTYYLTLNTSATNLSNAAMVANFELFQAIWNSGLVIFGFHILLIGYLMKLHPPIPLFLWVITLFAGASYVLLHLLKLLEVNPNLLMNLEMVLALPMAIGELGLAIWLLVKGGKKQ